MYLSLSRSKKSVCVLTLCACLLGFGSLALEAIAAPTIQSVHTQPPLDITVFEPQQPSAEEAPIELAHNGDGCEAAGAAMGSTVTSAQMMTITGHASHVSPSESLWGNLLLSLAYQRDPEIQNSARKLSKVHRATLISIIGISGLGLAQSITGLGNLRSASVHTEGHIGEEAQEADSKTPTVMGIVGTGATIATIGFQALMNRKYSHRISDRQAVIKERVEHILAHLKSGEDFTHVQAPLEELIGPVATQEFANIWRASQPSIDLP